MPIEKTKKPKNRDKRHSIELNPPKKNYEKSISTAFKIWIGIYALMVVFGFSIAMSPAKSAPANAALDQSGHMNSSPDLIILSGIAFLMLSGGIVIMSQIRKIRAKATTRPE